MTGPGRRRRAQGGGLSLGPHWERFTQAELQSSRYALASEVVRAALRELGDKSRNLQALLVHLAGGAGQAARGDVVARFDIEDVIACAKSGTCPSPAT